MRAMFNRVTKGMLSGNAGETPHEDFKVNGEYVDTPEKGIVGIPYLDAYIEKAALEFLDDAAKSGQAVLYQRQLHEGAPAQLAAPGLHP